MTDLIDDAVVVVTKFSSVDIMIMCYFVLISIEDWICVMCYVC